ncbi:hypothetical protein RZS08_36300, partial [Arthrospira platensis SPKY1]|nr:hypothetical protein [Arthrospira platensis SPKY1]
MRDPVQWTFSSEDLGGGQYEISFTATLQPGWTIYSQHTSPNDGPLPTAFVFEGEHYERVGEARELSAVKSVPEPLFGGVEVIKFIESPVVFKQIVKTDKPGQPITGYLSYMACDDGQ